jgi:predicted O-methyltransferase YrrM
MLAKMTLCTRPRRVLEVGSYRGYTTRLLAEHTAPTTTIVAFDRNPEHGEAYSGTPVETKIERRVGEMSYEAFARDARNSYDLIFLDADHTYESVRRDTEILLPLLAPSGLFVWHDYANWGRFSRKNGVPEFLHELSRTRPVAAVAGSWLAVHSPSWSGAASTRFEAARVSASAGRPGENPWNTDGLRG